MTDYVLGLDLSKVGLGQALEAMAEAWLDAQGVESPSCTPAPSPIAAASAPASKRSDWITRGWYVAPETAKGLKAYVNRAQEAGRKLDASEVVNEAIRQWLEVHGVGAAIAASAASSPTPDGMRLSDWIDNRPVVKATAYALMKALGIEPAKVRQAGISRPVSWLNSEMVAAMDAAVERLQGGATVAEIGRRNDSGCLFGDWIARRGCSKSTAYRMRSELGITPEKRRNGRAVDVWLTSEQEALMDVYAEALGRGLPIHEALASVGVDAQGVEGSDAESPPNENHHGPVRLSYWWESRGISRATAFRLVKLAQIEPGKMRVPGSRAPVSCLTVDQVARLDALADRIKAGETLPQLEALA